MMVSSAKPYARLEFKPFFARRQKADRGLCGLGLLLREFRAGRPSAFFLTEQVV